MRKGNQGQLRVCKEFAERNKINIIGEYIDRATTGTNDNRPEFQKLIADASKKEFEQILVYKLDRFSRNKYRSKNNLMDILKSNDFNFFVTLTFDKNKIDRLDDNKTTIYFQCSCLHSKSIYKIK